MPIIITVNYRALTDVMMGALAPIAAGQLIPGTYTDSQGNEHPVDYDRLVALGAAVRA